jgi:hypothetical protein
MKRVALVVGLLGNLCLAQAALPPQHQHMQDLDAIVAYIREHPEVAAGLRAIDLDTLKVYYGRNCKAVFARRASPKPPGWVGPAEPLELESSGCAED